MLSSANTVEMGTERPPLEGTPISAHRRPLMMSAGSDGFCSIVILAWFCAGICGFRGWLSSLVCSAKAMYADNPCSMAVNEGERSAGSGGGAPAVEGDVGVVGVVELRDPPQPGPSDARTRTAAAVPMRFMKWAGAARSSPLPQ